MKYLCLVYHEDAKLADLSEVEMNRLVGEMLAFTEQLQRSGYYLASGRLQPTGNAATVRSIGGRPVITDGPFAETKEQLGEFYVIEARDLNDAVRVASKMPIARWAGIEIRPIWDPGQWHNQV